MPTIIIETQPITPAKFDLIHSIAIGAEYIAENHIEFDTSEDYKAYAEPRLIAAICNLGFACRWFVDNATEKDFRLVKIPTDRDGKDMRYHGEHDTLYALLFPATDYESRKLRSLYAEYRKFLHRIEELEYQFDIRIELV